MKKVFKATFRMTTWIEQEIVADNDGEALLCAAEIANERRDEARRTLGDPDLDISIGSVEPTGRRYVSDHEG